MESIWYILMILYGKALQMCTYENFASWSRTLFPVPSYMLLILGQHFCDWCAFGYSMKHLCKTFWHTPLSLPHTPPPRSQTYFGLSKTEGKLKSLSSENDQIDRSPISLSRARYLHRVSTKCCKIFNIGKGHNYLGGKPPKFAISEILSLLFS